MKHFMYSRKQHGEQIKIAEGINKDFEIGRVYVEGTHKMYTEILTGDIPVSWYPDAILVASTDNIDSIKYTDSRFE